MAKPKTQTRSATHAEMVGNAAHAAMRHLGDNGVQVAHVDTTAFAELQDEGPTARAPEHYTPKGK